MTTSIGSSAALAVIEPAFSEAETLALAGFLAGYSGMTRQAYALTCASLAVDPLSAVTTSAHRRPVRGNPRQLATAGCAA